ncbi:MAG TPA: glycine cleavage system aminomethyltransferase GcvT [Porticoccaceae bacterium]|nr:glycine cleavage system aminomethyltransferase GcvT [Porticoccaceae bacterium]
MPLQTPLNSAHRKLGAKLVDFAGWEMPLHYGSQVAEHHLVRCQCAMFDVSHMSIFDITGPDARVYLRYLLANNVDKLSDDKQALYSLMLNPGGGIIDDLMVYRLVDGYRLVANSATREKVSDWMNSVVEQVAARQPCHGHVVVDINERNDMAMVAVQGPEAVARVQSVVDTETAARLGQLPRFGALFAGESHFARTGYTGEDGLEIILPAINVENLWWRLHEAGVAPAGLGARDTLRLEAGLNLYGQDMDESSSPLEVNLGWTVAWDPQDRDFVGRQDLLAQQKKGLVSKQVGVLMTERGVLRAGQKIFFADTDTPGVLTSGSFSPTLGYSIGLGRVPVTASGRGEVDIRGKRKAVRLLKPGFVRDGRSLVGAV